MFYLIAAIDAFLTCSLQGWARSQNRDKKVIRYDKIQFDMISI
jgi:hypothetical protein